MSTASPMNAHSFEVQWRYVVPPANCARVVISQRQDGPFRKDKVGGQGHYYVSLETYQRESWLHVTGSTRGGYSDFETAHRIATESWADVLPAADKAALL